MPWRAVQIVWILGSYNILLIGYLQMVRIIENYTLYEVVGEGAYGKVYRAVNKVDNKQYAVKVIEVKKFQTNKKLEECTVHEINILTNIEKNNHIITYYDMLKTQNNFYFVYEYCNGGTLEGMLRKQNTLDEKSALLIFKQLLQAFQVLNKYNIMHRDLKPDNIFFHNGVVKVGDFGFCKNLQKAEMTKTMLGSPIYMAPQILNGQIYSNKADIWSIGVVLYEMLCGYCPFESSSIPKLIQVLKQTELEFPNEIVISSQTKRLLKKILTKDPQKRIQWMELFQLKISNDGRIIDQPGKLDDDKNIMKYVKQTSQTDDPSSPVSPGGTNATGSRFSSYQTNNFNNFTSPRNVALSNPNENNQYKPAQVTTEDRYKSGLTKKPQGTIDEAETVQSNSPIRKYKSTTNGQATESTKDKVVKFHSELARGINIVRSMGLNNEKYTPLFTYHIFKTISERIKAFKAEQLAPVQNSAEVKQFQQILDSECDDIEYEMAMIRSKVEDFPDWKKAVKAKQAEIKNTRLCYELIMFLCGEPNNDSINPNEMRYVIRSKLG